MPIEVKHTWHVKFESDAVLYHVSWTKLTGHFRLAGFSVNPLPHSPYGLTIAHTHPGAVTLFTLRHPELIKYATILESP